MSNLHIKNALVIGATGGIGEAIVRELVADGFHVVISARNKEALQKLNSEIAETTVAVADTGKRQDIENLFSSLAKPVELVVIASGGWQADAIDMSLKDFEDVLRRQMEQNYIGPGLVMYAAGQHMKKHGGGLIVNISSHAASKVLPGNMCYSGSKAGIAHFIQALSHDFGSLVRIGDIQPAAVNTPSMRDQLGDSAGKAIQPKDIGKEVVKLTKETDKKATVVHMSAADDFTF